MEGVDSHNWNSCEESTFLYVTCPAARSLCVFHRSLVLGLVVSFFPFLLATSWCPRWSLDPVAVEEKLKGTFFEGVFVKASLPKSS